MSKKWYYVLAILLVAGSWVGNVWYYEANQLERTEFLEHHIEVREGGGSVFDLYYIEDKRAAKQLSSISIEGYPELMVTPQPRYVEYQRQYLGKMMVELNKPAPEQSMKEEQMKEPALIREITALYSDGSSEQVDVGEIYVLSEAYYQGAPFNGTSGGSSSDNMGYDSYSFQRPVQLTSFSSMYLSLLDEGNLKVHANLVTQVPGTSYRSEAGSEARLELSGKPIQELHLPVKINKGDSVKVSYQFINSPAKPMQVYHINFRLTYTEEEQGSWHHDSIISYHPSPTDKEMTEYVRERRKAL